MEIKIKDTGRFSAEYREALANPQTDGDVFAQMLATADAMPEDDFADHPITAVHVPTPAHEDRVRWLDLRACLEVYGIQMYEG